jgi:malate dehydrogenase (oxaloacetate-decarboxylating)(NADP+)
MCLGLSTGDIMSAQMLLGMSDNPIVLQWQIQIRNDYNLAIATRKDVIWQQEDLIFLIRSITFLVFHIFLEALDVRATKINEAMKMAAVKALALLTKDCSRTSKYCLWCYQIKFW